ncbi:hypothetical protein AX16_006779 [Volvariella volvacea WC 439]|nr:hypothetical protein AX16_006779 [Volvariella volvacea WC 439]
MSAGYKLPGLSILNIGRITHPRLDLTFRVLSIWYVVYTLVVLLLSLITSPHQPAIYPRDNILENLLPDFQSGDDLPTEIKCYSIPYGLLGFISHLLVYWTLISLWAQTRPLLPWSSSKPSIWNIALATISLIASASLAVYTLNRCHNSWQLLLIGVWKLFSTIAYGAAAIDANRNAHLGKASRGVIACIVFYCLGMIPGMVGLMNLVRNHWDSSITLKLLTLVFYALVLIGVVTGLWIAGWLCCCCCCIFSGTSLGYGLLVSVFSFIIGSALYSDWALGVMSGNLLGIPSGDATKLYWAYWAVERLPMLSL